MSTAEKIYDLVQELPSFRQLEILDFANYIAQRNQLLVEDEKPSFLEFSGVLKESSTFEGDPIEIQRALRNEWN